MKLLVLAVLITAVIMESDQARQAGAKPEVQPCSPFSATCKPAPQALSSRTCNSPTVIDFSFPFYINISPKCPFPSGRPLRFPPSKTRRTRSPRPSQYAPTMLPSRKQRLLHSKLSRRAALTPIPRSTLHRICRDSRSFAFAKVRRSHLWPDAPMATFLAFP